MQKMGSLVVGSVVLILGFSAWLHLAYAGNADQTTWKTLSKGLEYGHVQVDSSPAVEDGVIHVVRIDPAKAEPKLLLASEHDRQPRTASEWCTKFNLIVAINAGMYQRDHLTNVGYLKNGTHVQNSRWNRSYKSALAFKPKKEGLPAAVLIDLDEPGSESKLEGYRTVIQNLRLMKGSGINVWGKTDRKWSEAAVGIDKEGRILFLFCRSPYAMWRFNERVKSLPLDIVRLMHVEGGPEASLSIHSSGIDLDLAGSYETDFWPDNTNRVQWPVPNVIGIQALSTK